MIRTTGPTLAAWLLTAWTVAAPAHAFVLCARGDGDPNDGASVKVRSACKDNETAIDAALLDGFADGDDDRADGQHDLDERLGVESGELPAGRDRDGRRRRHDRGSRRSRRAEVEPTATRNGGRDADRVAGHGREHRRRRHDHVDDVRRLHAHGAVNRATSRSRA